MNASPDRPPAVILAGGRSSRMGSDKAALLLGGRPLLSRIIDRLAPQAAGVGINSNIIARLDFAPGIAVFADTVPGHAGPMAGVLSAMRHAAACFPAASHVVTVPTDTPFVPRDLVERFQRALTEPAQIAVACSAGIMHPVSALWPISLADELEHWLPTDEKRRVRSFIESHSMAAVDFPLIDTTEGSVDPFFNINTPADLETAERWLPLIEDMER
ncbi:molybdenum cofactor guanylyltransferase MobA [Rhizobium herbae]|uniref:Molybdenum cofactor guanylyltransferase n=1 Tax=Rhizobium herbae TaxID=508661 RepID=A0ABS7H4K7_9HYPH|nr:molybdenum cofactor guanylyltransferase MobA [Rhizobium herbae]MBW9062167.1 molybdenum cofactor guanylyltransferase MobA [Rhizobium herbae]